MSASIESYKVVAPAGVVIEDGGSSVLYPAGAVFQCRPRCPSVVRYLSSRGIVLTGDLEPAIPPPPGPVALDIGPTGLTGKRGRVGDRGPHGPVGPQGPVGTKGLVWRGSWKSTTDYRVDDAVCHLGSSFIAVKQNLNDPPFSANWSVLASSGRDGFAGRTDREGLTDKWLAIRARLGALPDATGANDPYATVRERLSKAALVALDEIIAGGGPA